MKYNTLQLKGLLTACLCLLVSLSFGQTTAEKVQQYLNSEFTLKDYSQPTGMGFTITDIVPHHKKPFTHIYVKQTYNGLPISNSSSVLVEKQNGEIIQTGDRLIKNLSEFDGGTSLLDPQQVLESVLAEAKESSRLNDYTFESIEEGKFVYKHQNELYHIPFEAAYYFVNNELHRVWECNIQTSDNLHWWSIVIDAQSAEVLQKSDWIVSCSFDNCSGKGSFHFDHLQKKDQAHQWMMAPAPPPENDGYRVFPLPIESPIHGDAALVTGSFEPQASPFGWHDTDGVPGEEFTITRGNNVYASEDQNDDNQPGFSPDGGPSLLFDFPITTTTDPNDYIEAAITNLFYTNNMMHDIFFLYGFDEASGNFQETNYTGQGQGGDFVFAEAQDGSGTNNANFATPPEGNNPRMQMYIWDPDGTPRMFYVDEPASIAGRYSSNIAQFGPPVPNTPLSAQLAFGADSMGGDPIDGCTQILTDLTGKIAYIRNGGCSASIKIENCQNAGAIGVVVGHNGLGNPGPMTGNPQNPITIPSLIVNINTSARLNNALTAGETVNVTLFDDGWAGFTDSDLDNVIIAHEYGHGISNRLTGGPSQAGCLFNEDQMGEGWSDFCGLITTMEPGDAGTDRRGIGTYVQNESPTGDGIRPTVYSTDFGINGTTFNATNSPSLSRPHGIGYAWATMLWDMTWALIDEYGFDADVKFGTGGNNIALELVMEGMKLQPCQPGFVDGRDAILEADELLNDGENQCLIWKVFAQRGLGLNADQGSTNDRFDQIEDFSLPVMCSLGLTDEEQMRFVQMYPNPSTGEFNIRTISGNKIQSVRVIDMNGRVISESNKIDTEVYQGNISDMINGVYLIEVQLERGKVVKRLMKQ